MRSSTRTGRAAGLIARLLGAQALLLVTAVDRVMLDYGQPTQSELGTITAAEAARHLADGQFPPGSMGPKIEAALRFLDSGGELAVITSPDLLAATLARRGRAIGHPHRAQPGPRGARLVSTPALQVFPGTYRDSLLLLSATRAMQDGRGVTWATAAMANPAAVEDLTGRGFARMTWPVPTPTRWCSRSAPPTTVPPPRPSNGAGWRYSRGRLAGEEPGNTAARTVGEAVARLPEANVAVVSVPGRYAALAAHSALSAGLHMLLFSDNVPLAEEVELKERARRLGLLLMGPAGAPRCSPGWASGSPTR